MKVKKCLKPPPSEGKPRFFFWGGKRPTLVIETNRIGFHGMDLVYFWLVVESTNPLKK